MKKTILSLTIAAVVGLATLTAAPRPAHAQWWIAPAIAGAVVLGITAGAAATNAYDQGYGYAPGYGYGYAYQPGYVYAPAYAYTPAYAYQPAYVYAPAGYVYAPNVVYVQPRCYYARAYEGYWRRVRICN